MEQRRDHKSDIRPGLIDIIRENQAVDREYVVGEVETMSEDKKYSSWAGAITFIATLAFIWGVLWIFFVAAK